MTRYLCTNDVHVHDGELHPVDLTAQVRLERALQPREPVYLAATERVIADVYALDEPDIDRRRAEVRTILTGSSDAVDAPVILASERAVLFQRPGMHELDALRRSEPAVDRLAIASGDIGSRTSGDLVVLDEGGAVREGTATATEPLATRTVERAGSIPQGIFDPWLLTEELAFAPHDRSAIEDAIRRTSRASLAPAQTDPPWRVVVTCPRAEGNPSRTHDVVFAGVGLPEAGTVEGTPVDTWDATLELGVATDLAPAAEVGRAERRLGTLLIIELVVLGIAIAATWMTGGLGMAARETPGWLAFGLAVAIASIGFGLAVLWSPRNPAGNVNDVLVVGSFFASRLQLLQIAAAIVAGGFALGALLAVVPPILVTEHALPAATVRFVTSRDGQLEATVDATVTSVATDTQVEVRMTSFASGEAEGTPLGVATATSDASGVVEIGASFAVDPSDQFLAVLIAVGDETPGTCGPSAVEGPGCVVVSLPGTVTPQAPTTVIELPAPVITPAVPVPGTAVSPEVSSPLPSVPASPTVPA